MEIRAPRTRLSTHEVTNQPPPLQDYNLLDADAALLEGLEREGAGWALEPLRAAGEEFGSERTIELGRLANRFTPELTPFDRFGHRIDEVRFHPAYHDIFEMGVRHGVHSLAWSEDRPGGHVAHMALEYMMMQAESGVCCPLTMTYAVIPALRHQPELAAEWEPRALSRQYDPRCIPAAEKTGATLGMAMTEKQGGSDVRTNSTRAVPINGGGPGGEYLLTGHKWFCSAPMCDAFLALAYTDGGLSCFLVPRWTPDGARNPFLLQRLKDKLGNRSNASSEVELRDTWARMVGEEGRGVRTIMEMVQHTRLDCALAAAGLMRQGLVQAGHHARHRKAFGKLLIDQPLMRNVLADLAVETEAATVMAMRVARAYDEGARDEDAAIFGRLAVAVAKYWNNKRVINHVGEAMESLGGAGYVEESVMPRMYREAPVNGIWEGSGNVICLDVLRAAQRAPAALELFLAELELSRGADRNLDRALDDVRDQLADPTDLQFRARRLTGQLARAFQGALLVRHAPAAVADAYCASRLGGDWGHALGTLPPSVDTDCILDRALGRLP